MPLPETIVILASIAPCRIERWKLPSAIKLWPRNEIAPAMWETYDTIRHQCQEGEAWLPVLTAYSLRCELLKLKSIPPELAQLISRLGEVSKAFAYTIQRLAEEDAAGES